MHPTIERLVSDGPVVTDGAWGTQLQRLGLPVGEPPETWNLARPEKVELVARAYVEAGSRIILTNTFGANRFALARHGLADKVAEINRRAVEISRRAAKGKGDNPILAGAKIGTVPDVLVFASIGPSGKMLITGEVSEEELTAAFAEQARAVAEAGADGIVVETMSDPAEAVLGAAAAGKTGLPVVACMTFDSGKSKDRTMTGATPEQAVEALTDAGVNVIGSNCGQGIAGMVEVCRRLRAATDLPIWIKPNAGLPEIVAGETVYRQTPAEFASYAPRLVAAGADFIGGCCGTTPEFIRAVVAILFNP